MDKESRDLADACAGCGLMLLSWPVLIIWKGFALNVLWGWFVTEPFGVAQPGLLVCAGLAVLLTLFQHPAKAKIKNGKTVATVSRSIGTGLLSPALALLFGGALHLAHATLR